MYPFLQFKCYIYNLSKFQQLVNSYQHLLKYPYYIIYLLVSSLHSFNFTEFAMITKKIIQISSIPFIIILPPGPNGPPGANGFPLPAPVPGPNGPFVFNYCIS